MEIYKLNRKLETENQFDDGRVWFFYDEEEHEDDEPVDL